MNEQLIFDQTADIPFGFGNYVSKMKRMDDEHRINGIPDYAFDLDLKLREQIRKLPYYMTLSKRIAIQTEARARQFYTTGALQVGPNQFPDIYEMTLDCAKRLHIGPPTVFVRHCQEMNAFTYAADTASPTIVIHSGIIERLTPGELKCVIGHECGHVHNEHQVYMSIVSWIESLLAAGRKTAVLSIISQATILLFLEWSRAAEVTCDRAGMICSDNVEDAIGVNKKLLYGSFLGREAEIDMDEIREQFGNISSVMSIYTEIDNDHPSSIRRILTSEEFTHCETLYEWRPEFKKPGMVLHTKEESDKICEKYTAVFKEKRKEKV